MHKATVNITLALLTVALAACEQPYAEAAQSYDAPVVQQAAVTTNVEGQWLSLGPNDEGTHFIQLSDYEQADWMNSNYLAKFKVEYNEPVGPVASLETTYDFNCTNKTYRFISSTTFDTNGEELRFSNELSTWQRPEENTIGEAYWHAACVPLRAKGG